MIFGKHVVKLTRGDKVILANQETGGWTRVSREVFSILEKILDNHYSIEETIPAFDSKEDYIFIKEVYDSLIKSNIICDSSYVPDSQPKLASVQMTNRCNLKCTHCCVDAGVSTEEVDLSTEQMKDIMDKIIVWNPLKVMLSGGEPMIRKDFMEILEYLRKRYVGKIVLSTNSLFVNKKNVKKLVEWCDIFEISIDGVDEETCAMVRGKGVFNKVCNNIALLQLNGAVKINLSMVFSDKNKHLKQRFYDLNKRLHTTPNCRTFSAVGRGALNKELFSGNYDEDIYIPSEYLSKDYDKPFGISFCSAGKRGIFIGADGTVYPCPSYMTKNFSMGNILSCDKISELIKKDSDQFINDQISKKHPKNLPQCKECSVRLFCWTCPGELNDIKTHKAFNRRCQMVKPVLMERVWEKEIRY